MKENIDGVDERLGVTLAGNSSVFIDFLSLLVEIALNDVATPTYLIPDIKGLKF